MDFKFVGFDGWNGQPKDKFQIRTLTLEHNISSFRLVAGFPPRRPGFASGQNVGFVMDKAALGQVFSEYFGFPCQSFHQFLHHNHSGQAQ
jgi:hypothetical protein